jgi:hypothetical protein
MICRCLFFEYPPFEVLPCAPADNMFAMLFKTSLNKNTMRSSNQLFLACSFALLALSSCNDDEPTITVSYTIPEIYAFQNVDFSGQTTRISQLEEMMEYVEGAIESKDPITSQVLTDMFENTDENGGGYFSFSSKKMLSDKCFGPHVSKIADYFDRIELTSASPNVAANGTAGYSESSTGSIRLYDENGMELSEFIEKGIMGAVFYYQATGVYLESEKMNVDNDHVIEGEGTAMQHHWDEAYGYLGVGLDFPQNVDNLSYWGVYCNRRNDLLGSNEALSEAFRRGRAAINVDLLDDDLAIKDVRNQWERVAAATIIHYLNEAIDNIGDDHVRNHVLSEGYAFIEGLFYNPEKTISDAEMNEILAKIGTNFYEVNTQDLQSARDQLSAIYSLDNVKSAL